MKKQKNCQSCIHLLPHSPYCWLHPITNHSEPTDHWKTDSTICGDFEGNE